MPELGPSDRRFRRQGVNWTLKDDVVVPEYRVVSVERQSTAWVYKTDFGEPDHEERQSVYSWFVIGIQIVRLFASYFFKIILPLLVILGMAYLVFWLPAKEVQTASALAITALLSCIAFNISVAQNLPEVSYLVASDRFFVFTYNLFEAKKLDAADRWRSFCRILFPIGYGLGFVYLVVEALILTAWRRPLGASPPLPRREHPCTSGQVANRHLTYG